MSGFQGKLGTREFDSPQVHVRENYIYLAGLIDGEGSILLTRSKRNEFRRPAISLTSTTPEIIDWLRDTFDGNVSKHKTYKVHYKQSWIWKLTKRSDVTRVLNGVLPYMKEPRKIARAIYILDKYNGVTKRNGKYSDEELQRKLDFEEGFMML